MNEQLSEDSNDNLNGQSIEELHEESIEILELDGDSLDSVTVRKSFRIPIREKNSFSILINGSCFPIEDINSKGAGILMVEDHSFFKGQLLSDCELILGSDKFSGVECQIVHITSVKDSPPLFGVKWLNMDDATELVGKKRLEEICNELKKNLLDDNIEETNSNN
ncbi:MAG: hypothetical protein HQK73_03750 [Desulfamplus sp.]|nr:hypothetical protein [Desulfamplus sp.]MBF0411357.1 hypothetical protein [Desulfamplus sp.]